MAFLVFEWLLRVNTTSYLLTCILLIHVMEMTERKRRGVYVNIRVTPEDLRNLDETIRKTGDKYRSTFIYRIIRHIIEPQDPHITEKLKRIRFFSRLSSLLEESGLGANVMYINNVVIIKFEDVSNEDY